MLNNLKNMLFYFGAHHNDIILAVVIMTSAIIALIGLLKPILFNKIQNKHIRKAALSFSNVFGCYLFAFIYFLIEGWNLKYYFLAGGALTVACVFTYWLYENTCLRNLIALIGNLALQKALGVIKIAITEEDINAVKEEVQNVTTQLKPTVRQELKNFTNKAKVDRDLINL